MTWDERLPRTASGAPGPGGLRPGTWPCPPPPALPPLCAPAPLGSRLLALWLDAAVFTALSVGLVAVHGQAGEDPRVPLVLILLLFLAYSPLSTHLWGGPPGKLLLGLRVVHLPYGVPLTYGRALARHAVHAGMQATFFLGPLNHLWCVWNRPLRQCLHDLTVDSVVVRKMRVPPEPPPSVLRLRDCDGDVWVRGPLPGLWTLPEYEPGHHDPRCGSGMTWHGLHEEFGPLVPAAVTAGPAGRETRT
jgi:uncharacterized RDD family membrane protein YckC